MSLAHDVDWQCKSDLFLFKKASEPWCAESKLGGGSRTGFANESKLGGGSRTGFAKTETRLCRIHRPHAGVRGEHLLRLNGGEDTVNQLLHDLRLRHTHAHLIGDAPLNA